MGNCNTPTCAIDGKINPENVDGTPLDLNPGSVNADPCGERGRRGERNGNHETTDAPVPRRDVMLSGDGGESTQTTFQRRDGGGSTQTTYQRRDGGGSTQTTYQRRDGGGSTQTTYQRRDGGATGPTVTLSREGTDPTGNGEALSRAKPGEVVATGPAVTLSRAGTDPTGGATGPAVTLSRAGIDPTGNGATLSRAKPGEVVAFKPTPTPTPMVAAPTEEELSRMTPKQREVYLSRARYAAAQQKSAGAVSNLSADDCYRTYLNLAPPVQAAIITSGILGRYGITQAVAQDTRNGVSDAPRLGADWLFGTFPRESQEMSQFCAAVALEAPSPAGDVMFFGTGADRWSRKYSHAQDAFVRGFSPAGEVALIDFSTAMQLFALLPANQQADILSGSAFINDPYAPALINALSGTGTIDGVLVSDLLAAHMMQFSADNPRRVLFSLAVQDAQRSENVVPAGVVYSINPSGVASTATARAPARTAPARTAPARTAPATPPPAAVPAAFLQSAGLSSTQWASLLRVHPDVAMQLWHEFQSRPSTFQAVATAALQAIGVVISGIHQGRVDDLAETNASYQHQQAMAAIAFQISQSHDQAEIARLQQTATTLAQQPPAQYQQPPAQYQQPPAQYQQPQTYEPATPPDRTPADDAKDKGWTTSQMALGALALVALVGGGAFLLTRRKPNAKPRRRRNRNRHAGRAR